MTMALTLDSTKKCPKCGVTKTLREFGTTFTTVVEAMMNKRACRECETAEDAKVRQHG